MAYILVNSYLLSSVLMFIESQWITEFLTAQSITMETTMMTHVILWHF